MFITRHRLVEHHGKAVDMKFATPVNVLTEGDRVVILSALDDSELCNLSRSLYNLLKEKGYIHE